MVWACMASSGNGSLVFIGDMTEDRGSPMNSKVYSRGTQIQILKGHVLRSVRPHAVISPWAKGQI